VNDTTPQPPSEPVPPPPPPPPAYTPPPLPPGYEQHYRPIYNPQLQHPKGPSNDSAVASIITACASLGFLIITAGILAPLTLIASGIAIPLGIKGRKNVDEGKTTQNRDIAVAGFWTGIAGVALSVIALIAWIVVLVIVASSDFNWTDSNGMMHHWSMH
jgi:hypothetical protein